ncbi:two-component sensor histidine kinase [Pseudoxanthomonas kalamensis DSM 18571]|uniref:sensor histidine kinase n=1 Tax=Pseudoxanthomonas kalamensis TaxID=289483 RepID=UPI00139095C3|nr:histidine kinase dimerization/phospho-acceptor domain-containing protein [Pseudoxanthomonas kalamensis]KAF1712227.1 two-component sensor histidine kinase [Pseudoxanthomonas kalamensis DSM 18571]
MSAEPDFTAPRRWSLRRRLTIGLVLVVGSVLGGMFVALDYWVDAEIYRRLDNVLLERARAVGGVLQARDLPVLEQLMPEYEPQGHTEFFTVYAADGHVLLHSSSSGGVALDPGPTGRGTPRFYDTRLPDGHAGRALATRLPGGGEASRLLVVATERESWDRTERRVHFLLMGMVALAMLLVVGLVLLILQHLFGTLDRTAGQVARLDADTPLQPIGADFPVELVPFADAFNLGIRRLYAAISRERRFASDVAHELRTPLAEIRAQAESSLASNDPSQMRDSLQASIESTGRMQRSVDTLLSLARLESGQEQPALDPLDLVPLLSRLLSALQPAAAMRGLVLHAELPDAAWVRSDIGIVERIVSNLLRNAIEYAPAGGTIDCCLEGGEDGWRLRLENAAPELTAADIDRFGERFWRKHPEGGTAQHTGLGLALSLGLAEALALPVRFALHAGRLSVRLGPWPAL